MIDLKTEKNITVIGYTETINSIRVLMKKVGDINSENILTDYIENLPYIDLNTDDLYPQKHKYQTLSNYFQNV